MRAESKDNDEPYSSNAVSNRMKRRAALIVIIGVASIFILYVLSLTMGAYPITFSDAMSQLIEIFKTGGNPEDMAGKIIYNLRMPRSFAVICVGAGLAVAGAVMQAMIHNPLVDPYVTGVSSGASFGVVFITLSGTIVASSYSIYLMPLGAIVGAVLSFILTMIVSEASGGKAMSYVLGGTIIAAGLSAGSTLMMSFSADRMHSITHWMFGSFANIIWEEAIIIALPTIIILTYVLFNARKLNAMLLGESQATYLGMNARVYKRNMLIIVAILTAFCVSFCGVIGFVGLVVPHICRMVVGGDHRVLIPSSIVVGALVLLVADIICKSTITGELPIGAITSVVGVPFFIYLMVKEGKRYAM